MYQNLKGHNVLYMIFNLVMNIWRVLCLAVFMWAMEFSLQVSTQKSFSLYQSMGWSFF